MGDYKDHRHHHDPGVQRTVTIFDNGTGRTTTEPFDNGTGETHRQAITKYDGRPEIVLDGPDCRLTAMTGDGEQRCKRRHRRASERSCKDREKINSLGERTTPDVGGLPVTSTEKGEEPEYATECECSIGENEQKLETPDNEWCECTCHSLNDSPRGARSTGDAVVDTGNRTQSVECRRCTGCASVVRAKCLSASSPSYDLHAQVQPNSSTTSLASAPPLPTATRQPATGHNTEAAAAASKVRLKVVYYHNRFVAVPVNSPPLPVPVPSATMAVTAFDQTAVVAAGAPSSLVAMRTTVESHSSSEAASCPVPTSIVVPLIMPPSHLPPSSTSEFVALNSVERQRVDDDLRPGGVDVVRSRQTAEPRRQRSKTTLQRIIECLEDRDVEVGEDDDRPLTNEMKSGAATTRNKKSRRNGNAGGSKSTAFETLVKTINLCFLATGLLLFLGVVAAIVYTSIDSYLRNDDDLKSPLQP